MPEQLCEDQAKLATAVVDAINDVYVAKHVLEAARKHKADVDQFVIALNNAMEAERHALAALNQHKKEHGCMNNSA